MCGENEVDSHVHIGKMGSSPRVRGKPVSETIDFNVCGLIPACAGKTRSFNFGEEFKKAHPRVCGENSSEGRLAPASQGSSPRVRGKPPFWGLFRGGLGLIPACAGKTAEAAYSRVKSWAHPRVCGENRHLRADARGSPGSSPRVRGKRGAARGIVAGGGLIPACAGKTAAASLGSVTRGAHPRVCGENRHLRADARGSPGSSPRVRGKRGAARGIVAGGGLIPACAGKTAAASLGSVTRGAHPRVCGENI